jgi:hypothetical protein
MKTLIAVISYDGDACNGNHQAIRDTWGKDCHAVGADLFFFVGRRSREFVPKSDEILVEWQEHRKCSHDWWVDVKDCCEDYWQTPTKAILRWSLENGYDFTFMIENDTFLIPQTFMTSGWVVYDFCGQFEPTDTPLGEKTKYEVYGENIYPSPEPGIGYIISRKAARIIVEAPLTHHTIGVYSGQMLGPYISSGEILARNMDLGSWHYRREKGEGYPVGSNWQKEMYEKYARA